LNFLDSTRLNPQKLWTHFSSIVLTYFSRSI
jgi:hypothetical protein